MSNNLSVIEILPQAIVLLYINTSLEFCKWIPSVLGLSPGDDMVTSWTKTPLQLSNLRWHCGLFWIVMPVTVGLILP